MRVSLREKKLKNGRRSLYLDFYPPIVVDNSSTRREHLKLYIYEKPKNELEREHNKETRILGENIKAQRQLELQTGMYGFVSARSRQKNFADYFSAKAELKSAAQSTYDNYRAALRQLIMFAGSSLTFGDINETFCANFKKYLETGKLKRNSAAMYFVVFKAVINDAFKEKLFPEKPTANVRGIETEEAQREYLTLEEFIQLANTPFHKRDVTASAIFATMSGLRFSDIEKLIWGEIQHSKAQGFYIRFKQKKTGRAETHPISDETLSYLGERGLPEEKVFPTIKYWQYNYYLPVWTKKAGINKHITFHSFRHSYATLQLTLGTDIYTVSKLLGHRNLSTTLIYAKIIDEKKREAANKITLK